MSLAREMVAAIAQEVAHDPDLARDLAEALAPYLPQHGGGWLAPADAVAYLGLGSLDALDRLVRDGLPCAQPSGPGGRRYFDPTALDCWMKGA